MKKTVIGIVLLLLTVSAMAQTPPSQVDNKIWGGSYGVLMEKGSAPCFAYTVTAVLNLYDLGGPLIQKIEMSAMYADRQWEKSTEIYALRTVGVKEFHFGDAYFGPSLGGYTFINSSGSDMFYTSVGFELGYRTKPLDIRIGGDVITREGADLYYPYIGLLVGL